MRRSVIVQHFGLRECEILKKKKETERQIGASDCFVMKLLSAFYGGKVGVSRCGNMLQMEDVMILLCMIKHSRHSSGSQSASTEASRKRLAH